MRITMYQFISLATAAGASIALLFVGPGATITWLDFTLKYQRPPVPRNYSGPLRYSGFHTNTTTGEQLFLESHFEGWKTYRYHFYKNFELIEQTYVPTRKLESIDLEKDTCRSAEKLAYVHGYLQCERDIEQLLVRYSPDELRQKLAIRKTGQRTPLIFLLVVSVFCFALARMPVSKSSSTTPRYN